MNYNISGDQCAILKNTKELRDKLKELGKAEAFIEAVQLKYLSSIVEVVEEAIDNELEYLIEQSSISTL